MYCLISVVLTLTWHLITEINISPEYVCCNAKINQMLYKVIIIFIYLGQINCAVKKSYNCNDYNTCK